MEQLPYRKASVKTTKIDVVYDINFINFADTKKLATPSGAINRWTVKFRTQPSVDFRY